MTYIKSILMIATGCCLFVVLGGCGDLFEKKSTEVESKAVIRDISRVRENPHVGNPLPQVYLDGPKRLRVDDGVKLFYFTKYMPVGDLNFRNDKDKNLEKRINGYGGTIRDLGFKVSSNPSTNQLIIHCADDAECDQVLVYLAKTDVPPIQVHIDCLILERFGDVTKDWETTLLIENLFGQEITLGESKYPNPVFPGAALRESRRGEFGLDFGYWLNQGIPGHQVRMVVDMLESRGYLKILMNPTLETVNGKSARVQIKDRAPIEKTVTERDNVYSVTDYKDVSDTLTVTPYVYADGYIGLKTNIVIGSKSKPEGVVQTPIITERSIDIAENRIEPGKSLVIGGMRKAENRSVVRGVPFLKDLPLIGILFSSKDFEENATEIVFILTPSISSGGMDYQDMADMVREKFESSSQVSDWDELMTDPMGTKAYSDLVGKEADVAEAERIRLQVQTAEVNRQAQGERLRTQEAALEAEAMRTQVQQAQAMIDKSLAQKKASEAQTEAAAKEAAAQQAKASQSQAEIEKCAKEAEAAKAQAQKAREELEKAERRANELAKQVEETRQKAAAIGKQIQELEKGQPSGEQEPEGEKAKN